MVTGKLKYAVGALLLLVLIMVGVFIYRLYFIFDRAKVKSIVEELAKGMGSQNMAYKLLIEACENIMKNPDMVAQVKILAAVDGTDKEQALVLTALNTCYSNGFIERPGDGNSQSSTPNISN